MPPACTKVFALQREAKCLQVMRATQARNAKSRPSLDTHVETRVMEAAPPTSPVWPQAKLMCSCNDAHSPLDSARHRLCFSQHGAKNVTERSKAVVYA